MAAIKVPTGYDLSRKWFDFCFENPEKINPNHTAMYFFIIEHCNRLGWKKKFGLPTSMAMEALGIKSYNTYKKVLLELIDFGFVDMVQQSKNQYSSNIVALSNFDKALDKAFDKALTKHLTKQSESTIQSTVQSTVQSNDSIDKPLTINQEPINKEQENSFSQDEEDENEEPGLNKGFFINTLPTDQGLTEMQVGATVRYVHLQTKIELTGQEISDQWEAFKIDNFKKREWYATYEDVLSHFRRLLSKKLSNGKNNSRHSETAGNKSLISSQGGFGRL